MDRAIVVHGERDAVVGLRGNGREIEQVQPLNALNLHWAARTRRPVLHGLAVDGECNRGKVRGIVGGYDGSRASVGSPHLGLGGVGFGYLGADSICCRLDCSVAVRDLRADKTISIGLCINI